MSTPPETLPLRSRSSDLSSEWLNALEAIAVQACRELIKEYTSNGHSVSVTPELIEKIRIDVRPLPFNQDSRFSQLQPLETIRGWLKDSEEDPDVPYYGYGRTEHSEQESWYNAHTLTSDLTNFLSTDIFKEDEDEIIPGPLYTAGWSGCVSFLSKAQGRRHHWFGIENVLQPEDRNMPHIAAFTTLDVPLKDGEVYIPELFSFCMLVRSRLNHITLGKRGKLLIPTVPVTIISCGDCYARVIHGWIDLETKKIVFNISPVVAFDQPGGYKDDRWIRLMSWTLAKPLLGKEGDKRSR